MVEAVRAREELHPTALDSGVALLHPRRPMPSILGGPILAMARTERGIPFGGRHGADTDLFFLICSIDDRDHLQTLARLSRLAVDPDLLPPPCCAPAPEQPDRPRVAPSSRRRSAMSVSSSRPEARRLHGKPSVDKESIANPLAIEAPTELSIKPAAKPNVLFVGDAAWPEFAAVHGWLEIHSQLATVANLTAALEKIAAVEINPELVVLAQTLAGRIFRPRCRRFAAPRAPNAVERAVGERLRRHRANRTAGGRRNSALLASMDRPNGARVRPAISRPLPDLELAADIDRRRTPACASIAASIARRIARPRTGRHCRAARRNGPGAMRCLPAIWFRGALAAESPLAVLGRRSVRGVGCSVVA